MGLGKNGLSLLMSSHRMVQERSCKGITLAELFSALILVHLSTTHWTHNQQKMTCVITVYTIQRYKLNAFQKSSSNLLSSHEIYWCSQKTEVSLVVLHIIAFHSPKYCWRSIQSIFKIDHIELDICSNLFIFLSSSCITFPT